MKKFEGPRSNALRAAVVSALAVGVSLAGSVAVANDSATGVDIIKE